MSEILIINGHPHPESSVAGRAVLSSLSEMLPQAETRSLADRIGPAGFDPAAEQKALKEARVIVIHFPMYWYSVPGLLKQWFDSVLTYGFAFGEHGRELEGKRLIFSFTTGAPGVDYGKDGAMGWPVEAFLPPLLQTAALCHIPDAQCVFSTGMQCWTEDDKARIAYAAQDHARRILEAVG